MMTFKQLNAVLENETITCAKCPIFLAHKCNKDLNAPCVTQPETMLVEDYIAEKDSSAIVSVPHQSKSDAMKAYCRDATEAYDSAKAELKAIDKGIKAREEYIKLLESFDSVEQEIIDGMKIAIWVYELRTQAADRVQATKKALAERKKEFNKLWKAKRGE